MCMYVCAQCIGAISKNLERGNPRLVEETRYLEVRFQGGGNWPTFRADCFEI